MLHTVFVIIFVQYKLYQRVYGMKTIPQLPIYLCIESISKYPLIYTRIIDSCCIVTSKTAIFQNIAFRTITHKWLP